MRRFICAVLLVALGAALGRCTRPAAEKPKPVGPDWPLGMTLTFIHTDPDRKGNDERQLRVILAQRPGEPVRNFEPPAPPDVRPRPVWVFEFEGTRYTAVAR